MLRSLSIFLLSTSTFASITVFHGPFEVGPGARQKRTHPVIKCTTVHDCGVKNGVCRNEICTCPVYHVLDGQRCKPGALLGSPCTSDSQCATRVPQSHCSQGVCHCSKDLLQYKKHLCLKPVDIGENCYSDEQCKASDALSYCKPLVSKAFGRCQCQSPHMTTPEGCVRHQNLTAVPCTADSSCSHLGISSRCIVGFCTCSSKFANGTDCFSPTGRGLGDSLQGGVKFRSLPVTLGQACERDQQCKNADPDSVCKSGRCECIVTGQGLCGSKSNGCYKDTFQCRSDGRCVSQLFVCNGKPDCDDGSDEECQGPICPTGTFGCGNPASPGFRCISNSGRCDGKRQCHDGSDESGCYAKNNGTCPLHTFQCNDGTCVPGYAFCNSIVSCPDLSDEPSGACRHDFEPVDFCPFRCSNGRCRSSSVLCSGRDGCGDNSDEKKCQICNTMVSGTTVTGSATSGFCSYRGI